MNRIWVGGWSAALVLYAAWAGTASGQNYQPVQYTPPSQPSGPSGVSDPDYSQREKDYADKWWDNQQKQQQQQEQPSWWSGGRDPQAPSLEQLTTWMTIALVGIVAVILVWLGARIFLRRWSGPADPAKLAMSDPWVRAHLAKSGGGSAGLPPREDSDAPR